MRCDPSHPAPPHTRTVPRGGGGLGVVVAFVRGICSDVNGDFSVGVAAKEVCGGWLCCEEVIITRCRYHFFTFIGTKAAKSEDFEL